MPKASKTNGLCGLDRLLICLHCLTGLRISDWSAFNPSQAVKISGMEFCRVVMTKTRRERKIQVAWIPVFEETRRLYGAIDPGQWNTSRESDQVIFNKAAKQVAAICGIIHPVNQAIRSRGTTEQRTIEKNALVSSKVCRKTFVSNMRSTGIPTDLLYLMTGHETGRSSAMANTYDTRNFEEVLPALLPYLAKFEANLPTSYDLKFM